MTAAIGHRRLFIVLSFLVLCSACTGSSQQSVSFPRRATGVDVGPSLALRAVLATVRGQFHEKATLTTGSSLYLIVEIDPRCMYGDPPCGGGSPVLFDRALDVRTPAGRVGVYRANHGVIDLRPGNYLARLAGVGILRGLFCPPGWFMAPVRPLRYTEVWITCV